MVSYVAFLWILPLFSGLVWLGMLLGLLLNWITIGEPIYPSMNPGQTIAYISDTAAYTYKPLFIAGSTVTVVCLDLSLIAERWLRHTGRLAPDTTWFQKLLSCIAIIGSIAGAAGLILLSCFDTYRHPTLHDKFLALFIIGYIVSAIFICWEFQRLGVKFRKHPIIRVSFWIKLFFIVVEIALAIPFGIFESSNSDAHVNTGAIIEWVIALVFFFYVISYMIDLLPAVRHQERGSHPVINEVGMLPNNHGGFSGSYQVDGERGFVNNNAIGNADGTLGHSRNF